MRSAWTILLTVMLWLFAAAPLCANAKHTGPDEAPAARAYLNTVLTMLDQMEAKLPAVAQAADAAARRYIAGADLGVRDGAGLAWELADRPGGLADYHGSPGRADQRDIILIALGDAKRPVSDAQQADVLSHQLTEARALREAGCLVIGFASYETLQSAGQLESAQSSCTFLLDNHADNAAATQTDTIANAVLAWTFECELFAACTRQGETPVMLKSLDIDYRRKRFNRYRGLRFHYTDQTAPIEAGSLGSAYLQQLRRLLVDVGSVSWPALARTAHQAADTLRDRGRIFVRATGAYLAHHHGRQLDARIPNLIPLDHDGSDRTLPTPGADDFVIAFGYIDPPGWLGWGEPELLRQGGRGSAWILSAYLTEPARDLRSGDLLIDAQWPIGDALVRPTGYDVRIGSASGVIAETIYWAIHAQIQADLQRYKSLFQRDF